MKKSEVDISLKHDIVASFLTNILLKKLPLLLLCTIKIEDSLFDCHVLPQQGCNGATGQGTWVPYPFGINTKRPRSFPIASNSLRM